MVVSLSSLLDRLSDPVIALDQSRRVLYANATARVVMSGAASGLKLRSDRLGFDDQATERTFDLAMAAATAPRAGPNVCRAVRVPRRNASAAWIAVISVLHSSDAGAATERQFLVHLVGRVRPRLLSVTALHDLYDLTPRELTVVTWLMRGTPLRDIAEELELSHETIRVYVKRILRKCEVESQVDLLALLQRMSLLLQPN